MSASGDAPHAQELGFSPAIVSYTRINPALKELMSRIPANGNVPVFPAEGSMEWHWLMSEIDRLTTQQELDWVQYNMDGDRDREWQLGQEHLEYPDESEWPWYADEQWEVQEPQVFKI